MAVVESDEELNALGVWAYRGIHSDDVVGSFSNNILLPSTYISEDLLVSFKPKARRIL